MRLQAQITTNCRGIGTVCSCIRWVRCAEPVRSRAGDVNPRFLFGLVEEKHLPKLVTFKWLIKHLIDQTWKKKHVKNPQKNLPNGPEKKTALPSPCRSFWPTLDPIIWIAGPHSSNVANLPHRGTECGWHHRSSLENHRKTMGKP